MAPRREQGIQIRTKKERVAAEKQRQEALNPGSMAETDKDVDDVDVEGGGGGDQTDHEVAVALDAVRA